MNEEEIVVDQKNEEIDIKLINISKEPFFFLIYVLFLLCTLYAYRSFYKPMYYTKATAKTSISETKSITYNYLYGHEQVTDFNIYANFNVNGKDYTYIKSIRNVNSEYEVNQIREKYKTGTSKTLYYNSNNLDTNRLVEGYIEELYDPEVGMFVIVYIILSLFSAFLFVGFVWSIAYRLKLFYKKVDTYLAINRESNEHV